MIKIKYIAIFSLISLIAHNSIAGVTREKEFDVDDIVAHYDDDGNVTKYTSQKCKNAGGGNLTGGCRRDCTLNHVGKDKKLMCVCVLTCPDPSLAVSSDEKSLEFLLDTSTF